MYNEYYSIAYLKAVKRADLKNSQHKKRNVWLCGNMLTRLIVVIILHMYKCQIIILYA